MSTPSSNPADEETLRPSEGKGSENGADGGSALNLVTLPEHLSLRPQDLSADKLLSTANRISVGEDHPPVPTLGEIPLLSKLGQGGMGAVYYGIHPRLEVEVAVKILPFNLAEQQPDMVKRFYREAKVAVRVKSPHLVGVMDVNEEGGLYYIIMEFVRGKSAGDYLKKCKQDGAVGLPESIALDICMAACKGVAVAHENGVIHRDLKPDNIMLPFGTSDEILRFDKAKVADLGLARNEEVDQSLTGNQQAMGTPGYMAPEQGMDAKTAGKPADVFSLGATLYALLSGQAPFAGSSVMKILIDTAQAEHPPLGPLRPDVSTETLKVIDRCLEKEPGRRYPDAAALLEAFAVCRAALLEGTAPPSTPPSLTLPGKNNTTAVDIPNTVVSPLPTPATPGNKSEKDPDTSAPLAHTVITGASSSKDVGADSPSSSGSKSFLKRGLWIAVGLVVLLMLIMKGRDKKSPTSQGSASAHTQSATGKASEEGESKEDSKTSSTPTNVPDDGAKPDAKPEPKSDPSDQKKTELPDIPAQLAKLVVEAKAGDLKAGARMIDLLMFEEMGRFTQPELNALAKWKTARTQVGRKHAVQILAVFMAHQTARKKLLLSIARKARMLLARSMLKSRPLNDPVLLNQMAWLARNYDPKKVDEAEQYIQKALAILEKEEQDAQPLPDLERAMRLMLKGFCLLPDRNAQGDGKRAAEAFAKAEAIFKKLGYQKGIEACRQQQERARKRERSGH